MDKFLNKELKSWTIKEAISLGIFHFAFLFTYMMSLNIVGKYFFPEDLSNWFAYFLVFVLPSIGLIAISLIWILGLKKARLSSAGLSNTKMRFYIYAFLIAIGVWLLMRSFFYFNDFIFKSHISFNSWAFIHLIVIAPVGEELYFRGIFFKTCNTQYGLFLTLLISGV